MSTPICHRCKKETIVTRMSYFNTDILCPDCIRKEKKHPKYEEARIIENEEVKKGNYNYPGIGLPEDLKSEYDK